jgi:hypothetical protein
MLLCVWCQKILFFHFFYLARLKPMTDWSKIDYPIATVTSTVIAESLLDSQLKRV